MNAAATPDRAGPPIRSRGRWVRWVVRAVAALVFVGLPLLGMAGLATLWVRSQWVEDSWSIRLDGGNFNPATQVHRIANGTATIKTTAGLLSIQVDWESNSFVVTDPNETRRLLRNLEDRQASSDADDPLAWQVRHETKEPAATGYSRYQAVQHRPSLMGTADRSWYDLEQPENQLGLPRTDGIGRSVLFWTWVRLGTFDPCDYVWVVAPFWVWMLPLAGPVLWWIWCPSGRAVPRLTLRRTMAGMAGVALTLALLGRSSPTDYAVLTLQQFDGGVLYGPDPTGLGRRVIVAAAIHQLGRDHKLTFTAADAALIKGALGRLPDLRSLDLAGNPGPLSNETAMLPSGLLALECLDLRDSNADAATLARLVEYPRLRRLALTRSEGITDASLAALRALPALTHLWLGESGLSDAGLDHLHGLTKLRRLDFKPLWSVDVHNGIPDRLTPTALQRLADSLPNLEELVCPDGTILRPHPKAQP